MRRNVGVIGTVIAIVVSTYLSIVHRPEAMPELDELIIWFLPLALTGILWIAQEILVMRKLKNIQSIATALREKFNLDDTVHCDATVLLFLLLQMDGDPGVLLWFLPAAIVMVSWIVQIIRTVRMVARVERDMRALGKELGAESIEQRAESKD